MILKITTNLILTTDKNTAKNSTPSPDRDMPSEAFPLGIRLIQEGDYFYRIAEPEKALFASEEDLT